MVDLSKSDLDLAFSVDRYREMCLAKQYVCHMDLTDGRLDKTRLYRALSVVEDFLLNIGEAELAAFVYKETWRVKFSGRDKFMDVWGIELLGVDEKSTLLIVPEMYPRVFLASKDSLAKATYPKIHAQALDRLGKTHDSFMRLIPYNDRREASVAGVSASQALNAVFAAAERLAGVGKTDVRELCGGVEVPLSERKPFTRGRRIPRTLFRQLPSGRKVRVQA